MADNIIGNMFGVDPDQLRMQRWQQAQQQNMQMAQMDPFQRASASMANAGSGLTMLGAQALGLKTPEERLSEARKQAMSGIDTGKPDSMFEAARKLNEVGDTQGAMMLANNARALKSELSRQEYETAKTSQAEAMAEKLARPEKEDKGTFKVTELPDPSDPAKVVKVLYNDVSGQIKQLPGSGQKFRDAKDGDKLKKTEEGKLQLTSILGTLKENYDELNKMGALVSENKDELSNVKARFMLTTAGQGLGGTLGTKVQSRLDSIQSLRPSLVSALKTATGKSASEMNSNVELRLALDQATNPKFGYEANLRQIQFLNDTYGLGLDIPKSGTASKALSDEDLLAKYRKK